MYAPIQILTQRGLPLTEDVAQTPPKHTVPHPKHGEVVKEGKICRDAKSKIGRRRRTSVRRRRVWQPEALFLSLYNPPLNLPPPHAKPKCKPIRDDCGSPLYLICPTAGRCVPTHTDKWHLNFLNIPLIKCGYRRGSSANSTQHRINGYWTACNDNQYFFFFFTENNDK